MGRYARGDAAAFERLYRRHELRIWRYLERHVGNRATADELMQEVWFAVARDAERYAPSARFTSWLFTIAHNRMIDAMRARREHMSLESQQLISDPTAGPLAAALARNVYGAPGAPKAAQLAEYVFAVDAALALTPIEDFAAGRFRFPEGPLDGG